MVGRSTLLDVGTVDDVWQGLAVLRGDVVLTSFNGGYRIETELLDNPDAGN